MSEASKAKRRVRTVRFEISDNETLYVRVALPERDEAYATQEVVEVAKAQLIDSAGLTLGVTDAHVI